MTWLSNIPRGYHQFRVRRIQYEKSCEPVSYAAKQGHFVYLPKLVHCESRKKSSHSVCIALVES